MKRFFILLFAINFNTYAGEEEGTGIPATYNASGHISYQLVCTLAVDQEEINQNCVTIVVNESN